MRSIAETPINKHCNCIAINHPLHLPRNDPAWDPENGFTIPTSCDEPAPATGEGVCLTCRYVYTPERERGKS